MPGPKMGGEEAPETSGIVKLGRKPYPYEVVGTFPYLLFEDIAAAALQCYVGPHALIDMETHAGPRHGVYFVQHVLLTKNYIATYHVFNGAREYVASVRVTPADAGKPETATALIYFDTACDNE